MFHQCYGHVLTDDIRRAWFLKSEVFKKEFKTCPLVYIAKRDTVPGALVPLLKILEVDVDRLRPITEPTQFDKIILPDESFLSLRNPSVGITAEYIEAMDTVRNFALKNRTPTSIKKCYFFYGRKGIGEERMAEYFKSKGYDIISPEKLTFKEQLNLLINCESFASTLGSCAQNSVFLRDGTETIFIPRFLHPVPINYQEMENLVHPLNVNYVDSTLSIFAQNPIIGSSVYIISEQLKRFFGDKWNGYEEEDFKLFLQYVKDSMNQGLSIIPQRGNYYAPIFSDFIAQLKRHKDLIATYDMLSDWDTFRFLLSYQTHVHMKGWRDGWKVENQYSNPLDQECDIQAIKINFLSHKIYYSVYFNEKEGWSQEVMAPDMVGTTGKIKPIYGMRVRLDEAGAREFDVLYRMHKFDDTWTPWAKNGEELYSNGIKVNAIQIKLEPVNIQLDEEDTKNFDELQTFLTEGDEIHPQGQRQDLTQIKLT